MPLDQKPWPENEIAKTLLEASELIKTCGHMKHNFGSKNEGFCIHGAIGVALMIKKCTHVEVVKALAEYMYKKHKICIPVGPVDKDVHNFVAWNDQPERTKEEVITALEGAAEYALEKEKEHVV